MKCVAASYGERTLTACWRGILPSELFNEEECDGVRKKGCLRRMRRPARYKRALPEFMVKLLAA